MCDDRRCELLFTLSVTIYARDVTLRLRAWPDDGTLPAPAGARFLAAALRAQVYPPRAFPPPL